MRLSSLAVMIAAAACGRSGIAAGQEAGERPAPRLELREIVKNRVTQVGRALPDGAVRVFTYEGQPSGVRVGAKHIAVAYERSGVLFERATGLPARRFTVADGWPERRPEEFGPKPEHRGPPELVGPGVVLRWRGLDEKPPEREVVAAVEFAGRTWQATQPGGFLSGIDKLGRSKDRDQVNTWTAILRRLSDASWLEAAAKGDARAVRFTTKQGLAGNIVTRLAVADGTLWAACADIFDPKAGKWGPGGLCRYVPAEGERASDPAAGRWERFEKVDGREVRWVTLLQAVGDELWVGFREGAGVEGDSIAYGMGLYPGDYRPKTAAVVLARLAGGKWTSFARLPVKHLGQVSEPAAEQPPPFGEKPFSPTEKPWSLALVPGSIARGSAGT